MFLMCSFSQLPVQELSDTMGMPTCEYSVHSGSVDGPLLSYASVGDIVCNSVISTHLLAAP